MLFLSKYDSLPYLRTPYLGKTNIRARSTEIRAGVSRRENNGKIRTFRDGVQAGRFARGFPVFPLDVTTFAGPVGIDLSLLFWRYGLKLRGVL